MTGDYRDYPTFAVGLIAALALLSALGPVEPRPRPARRDLPPPV